MIYVKSCYKDNNPLLCKTIKIGSLHEYRASEDKQIADCGEGNIEIELMLEDLHLNLYELQPFLDSHNSYGAFEPSIFKPGGPSEVCPGKHHLHKLHAKSSLSRLNKFIFCLSYLDDTEEYDNIFPDYDDRWCFSKDKINDVVMELAKSLCKEIWKRRNEVFPENVLSEGFEVLAHWNKITYIERKILIDNYEYNNNRDESLNLVKSMDFLKPSLFSHEHEFRVVFDVYDKGVLLNPKVNSIIINAENILSYIEQ